MATQTLMWTALPNGYSDDGQLRLSVLLTPRLDPGGDANVLGSFPDFYDDASSQMWTDTLMLSQFRIQWSLGGMVIVSPKDEEGKNRIDARWGKPDATAWRALFTEKTYVRGYQFKDLGGHKVVSYSVLKMDQLVRDLYKPLAANAGDELPKPSDILGTPGWSAVVGAVQRNDARFVDRKTGLRDPRRMFNYFREGALRFPQGGAETELPVFELFHTPSGPSYERQYNVPPSDPRARAKWLEYKQTPLPKPDDFVDQIDFHQIVAAMNQYPILLRKLGLVIDFLLDPGEFTPSPNASLSVDVILPAANPQRQPNITPHTRTLLDTRHFQPVPRANQPAADYRVANGLLTLDPDRFALVQQDPDAAGFKVMNFARTLGAMESDPNKRVDPVSQRERPTGAPSLRNAGLVLVQDGRGESLANRWDRQKSFNTAAEKSIQSPPTDNPPDLNAEDLVRGFRIDIWDGTTQKWRSLCQREANYILNAGPDQMVLDDVTEEGTVRLAATKSADESSNPDLVWLHEALMAWTGWSLVAPPPGQSIRHNLDANNPNKHHLDEVDDPTPEVPPGLRLQSRFTVTPGSLPRLRYGRQYWLRARVVDLASNSLDANEKSFGPEKPEKHAVTYFRYEPIAAPALALFKPTPATVQAPAEGESMGRMVVRTFNATPADNTVPSTQVAYRYAVPERISEREAEYHGMLDQKGVVDPAWYATLRDKDAPLPKEQVAVPGAVKADYAALSDNMGLPYLPDPLALEMAARLFGVPGWPDTKIIRVPLYKNAIAHYPDNPDWPNALPFKVQLYENPADSPHFDAASLTLYVPLAKAARATLRLSVTVPKDALAFLGIWNWLTPNQQTNLEKMALNGQHWMLSPWREVDLVHAVQKPLIIPEISQLQVRRELTKTHAHITYLTTCSLKSTDHLDLLAQWHEPGEDPATNAPIDQPRKDNAFKIKITRDQTFGGTNDYQVASVDKIWVGQANDKLFKVHEFNDTRYRRIEYWQDATTAFREFLPASLLTKMGPSGPEDTDENIKVTGPLARTWIPNSAPPPAPHVLYVVPTFGWVRSQQEGKASSWRRGGGLRVYLEGPWNVTGYGEMLAVVIPPADFAGDPNAEPKSQPFKNFVTQWGNDPIWKSPFVADTAPRANNFPLARVKADPAGQWLPPGAPATEADQPPGPFQTTALSHPELINPADWLTRVAIAPHDVFYDADRKLWYCDIEVNWGRSYYPFIRLALARYQPVSVGGAHLSNIVLADFMALVPDRWLNVTATDDPLRRRVGVYGYTYGDSSGNDEVKGLAWRELRLPDGTIKIVKPIDVAQSSIVEVWVERLDPSLGEDFGWKRDPDAVAVPDTATLPGMTAEINQAVKVAKTPAVPGARARATKLLRQHKYSELIAEGLVAYLITPTLWEGSVVMPQSPDEAARYRLAIAEYEEYLVDDENPYDQFPTKKDRRLVFMEYVELK